MPNQNGIDYILSLSKHEGKISTSELTEEAASVEADVLGVNEREQKSHQQA